MNTLNQNKSILANTPVYAKTAFISFLITVMSHVSAYATQGETQSPDTVGGNIIAGLVEMPDIDAVTANNITASTVGLAGDLRDDGGGTTVVTSYWESNEVVTLALDYDTYIDSGKPTQNYGTTGGLKAVNSTTPSHILFKLPMSFWNYDLSRIVSAKVSLYTWNDTTAGQNINLYALTRSFVEGTGMADGATWLTYDGVNGWDTPGGDYDGSIGVTGERGPKGVYAGDNGGRFFTWDLMPLLTNAATRALIESNGALLDAGSGASPQRFCNFNSSEKSGYPAQYQPMVTVVLLPETLTQSADLGVLPIGVFTNSVNGLRPGTSYAYAFTAANEEGTVWSRTNTFTTTADAPVIVNVSASNITNSSAKLNALLLSDGGLPTWVYYRYGTDTNSWATTEIDGAKTQGELSQDVTDLMAGTTYYYQFAASNALGFVWAPAIDSLTTPYDVKLSGISIEDGVIIGVIENLTPGTPNVVERSFDLKQDTWTFVSNITSDSVSTNWFEPIKPEWTNVFYRVRRDL